MSTTTSHLQQSPDHFPSMEEAARHRRCPVSTNPRYSAFTHNVFHCGDEEQFHQYRDATNHRFEPNDWSLEDNLFRDCATEVWDGHAGLDATAVTNTFLYIFHKFKKGIFVKIANNQLRVFLPFSKHNFENEWGDRIKVDPTKYKSIKDFIKHVHRQGGYPCDESRINGRTSSWYANNALVRYEWPVGEGETNVLEVQNMLQELCAHRRVPDIEFFVNRRDYPILTRDGTEPYDHLWGSETQPLVSHAYRQYLPVLSMSKTARYADTLSPTGEDWARVQSLEDKWFPSSCKSFTHDFGIPWDHKVPTAVFRGASTGCGVTADSNPRLRAAQLSAELAPASPPLIDAGITKWNLRPRKLRDSQYLQTIDVRALPPLTSYLSPSEQAAYKYVLHIEGHVAAFRLPVDLQMGSVVLMVESPWKLWFTDRLVPFEHYIPVTRDLSDLAERVQWCRDHDGECRQIADNARAFYDRYLGKPGILDYLQKTLVDLHRTCGVYMYHARSPLDLQLDAELATIRRPRTPRPGPMRDVEETVRRALAEGRFEETAVRSRSPSAFCRKEEGGVLFRNKLGSVVEYALAGHTFAVKTTRDQQKAREHVHEVFVGLTCLNDLRRTVPNFAYIFGLEENPNGETGVIVEKIDGVTLFNYVDSRDFNLNEFLLILLQLCLALEVAQNACGFVHWDLTPWNVVLRRLRHPETHEYIVDHDRVYRVTTSVIPVVIDFGKSHTIADGVHHGFIQPYHTSTARDVVTLLVTTMNKVVFGRRLGKGEFALLKRVANFLVRTNYVPKPFHSAHDLKAFLLVARRSSQIFKVLGTSVNRTRPVDLVRHILDSHTRFPCTLLEPGKTRDKEPEHAAPPPTKTPVTVSLHPSGRTIDPPNLFWIYCFAQQICRVLETSRVDPETLHNAMAGFEELIQETPPTPLERPKLPDRPANPPYTVETFLQPATVERLLDRNQRRPDLSTHQQQVQTVLLDNGPFRLSKAHRAFYTKNLGKLLSTPTAKLRGDAADRETLHTVTRDVYESDRAELSDLIAQGRAPEGSGKRYQLLSRILNRL